MKPPRSYSQVLCASSKDGDAARPNVHVRTAFSTVEGADVAAVRPAMNCAHHLPHSACRSVTRSLCAQERGSRAMRVPGVRASQLVTAECLDLSIVTGKQMHWGAASRSRFAGTSPSAASVRDSPRTVTDIDPLCDKICFSGCRSQPTWGWGRGSTGSQPTIPHAHQLTFGHSSAPLCRVG